MSATSYSGSGFLTFNKHSPRLWLTSTERHAPEKTLLYWKDEGFDVNYIPYTANDQAGYAHIIKTLHENLNFGETYALVCYGEPASTVLKIALKPLPKCSAIIAYYPPILPSPKTRFPSLLRVVVHVAGLSQISPPPFKCDWKCYRYERCSYNFADPEADNYSPIEADLAATRSLSHIRKSFKMDVDLEPVIDEVWRAKYDTEEAEHGSHIVVRAMSQASPHVTVVPTLEGGLGRKNLQQFYEEFFIPSLVEDFEIRLLSRTIGVDRIVDEMLVSFTHSDEVDWILPGVPPTDRRVEIAIVSIVAVRGGKLISEHMYWDQASVLVQIGLLDPQSVPKKLRDEGLKKLPVADEKVVQQLIEPRQTRYNGLLKDHGLIDNIHLNGVNGS